MAEWTHDQIEYLFYFLHPAKSLSAYIEVPEDIEAILWKLDDAECARLRTRADDQIAVQVGDLLKDPDFVASVEHLPFTSSDIVVALGDSITDYSMSWLELLRAVCGQVMGERTPRFVNAGVSGDTTADMLRRFQNVIVEEPTWVITLAGTNDAKLFYGESKRTFVSAEETRRNLKMLSDVAKTRLDANMVWMTPPPVVESMVRDHWLMQAVESVWLNENLAAVADAVKSLDGIIVDLQDKFGNPVREDLFLPDGLHPSVAGEAAIVKSLINTIQTETA